MVIVFLLAMFGFILLNIPIAFSLILTSVVLMLYVGGFDPQPITQNMVRGVDNFPLLAIPFFMIAGEIMNKGGLSTRIVGFARALVGHISGGLGYVSVVASMIFAGVSGSAVADTTAIGSILLPVMKDEGYEVGRSTALVASAGCIGPIIPPSIPMILFGVVGEVSIVKLFLGGIVPGVLIGVGLMIGWYFFTKKNKYKSYRKASAKEIVTNTKEAFWALFLPIIIMGGIITGIATPTESAVVAVVYAFIISKFVYRELKLKDMPDIMVAAMKGTAIVMFVCGSAMVVAYFITLGQVPVKISEALLSISDNPMIIMLVINILILFIGCVMDMTPALLIMTPILLPIVTGFGLDPVYFGVVLTVNLCIGLLTPPIGTVLYVGCGLSKITMAELVKPLLPFITIMVVVLFIITYIPGLIMFIPNMVVK